jgi:hypothetical protein
MVYVGIRRVSVSDGTHHHLTIHISPMEAQADTRGSNLPETQTECNKSAGTMDAD